MVMALRRTDLPIMIGKGMRKGLVAGPSQFGGAADLYVVWLNKDLQPGSIFCAEDIDKVNAVITFSDKQSVKETIDVLTTVLMKMEDKGETK